MTKNIYYTANRIEGVIPINPKKVYRKQKKDKLSKNQEDLETDYDDIQLRAYLIYQKNGASDLINWLETERMLRKKLKKTTVIKTTKTPPRAHPISKKKLST